MLAVSWVLALLLPSLVSCENLFFHPVHGPFGVLAVTECLSEVVCFLLEELWLVADCFDPVGRGINYTVCD